MTARDHRQRSGQSGLQGFSDHPLRDIGYVRERTVAPRKHVLWM